MRSIPSVLLLLLLCLPALSQAQTDQEILSEAHALLHQASDERNQDTAKNL